MINFSHLSKLKVSADKTVDYDLYQLEGEPVLQLLPATEANKPYFNALLRASRKNVRAVQSKKVNVHTIENNRNEDRQLYGKFIVKGWKGIVDSKGKEVEFSEENVLGFLAALPNEIFDDMRTFASETDNFIESGIAEQTSKNS